MFRRRRRLFRRLAASPAASLARANQLLPDNPAQAGPLFAQMADEMQRSNRPLQAANLHARAAHAFAESDDEPAALAQARLALSLFLKHNLAGRAPVFFANITRKLRDRGMPSAAATIEQEFGAKIASLPTVSQPAEPLQRGLLPASCPQCGASLHRDEVDWVDSGTAECAYCGSLIRAE